MNVLLQKGAETQAAQPSFFSDSFWAMVGVGLTAIFTFFGTKYLEARKLDASREAVMEKEIRRLRLYSWANTRKVELRLAMLEQTLEGERAYSEKLRTHINLGYGPPAPDREPILKPKIEISDLVESMTNKEIDEEIDRIIEESGAADTGPIETIK